MIKFPKTVYIIAKISYNIINYVNKREEPPLKTTARQIAIDMYKCKASRFENLEALQAQLQELMNEAGLTVLSSATQLFPEDHMTVCVIFPEGSLTIHVFANLDYVSVDLYLCQENATPEKYFAQLKKLFKPEKTKTTLLKRGDFGTVKDMKPKTKTRIAPLRRISNTGTKVIRLLSRKG